MHSSHSLLRRLAALEQRRSNAQTMCILFGGRYADQHVGTYVVRAGGTDHLMERTEGESWNAFKTRADKHVTGVLRLCTFTPIDEAGNQLYMNDEPLEDHENA